MAEIGERRQPPGPDLATLLAGLRNKRCGAIDFDSSPPADSLTKITLWSESLGESSELQPAGSCKATSVAQAEGPGAKPRQPAGAAAANSLPCPHQWSRCECALPHPGFMHKCQPRLHLAPAAAPSQPPELNAKQRGPSGPLGSRPISSEGRRIPRPGLPPLPPLPLLLCLPPPLPPLPDGSVEPPRIGLYSATCSTHPHWHPPCASTPRLTIGLENSCLNWPKRSPEGAGGTGVPLGIL